jgi:hypothetical protein
MKAQVVARSLSGDSALPAYLALSETANVRAPSFLVDGSRNTLRVNGAHRIQQAE